MHNVVIFIFDAIFGIPFLVYHFWYHSFTFISAAAQLTSSHRFDAACIHPHPLSNPSISRHSPVCSPFTFARSQTAVVNLSHHLSSSTASLPSSHQPNMDALLSPLLLSALPPLLSPYLTASSTSIHLTYPHPPCPFELIIPSLTVTGSGAAATAVKDALKCFLMCTRHTQSFEFKDSPNKGCAVEVPSIQVRHTSERAVCVVCRGV